MKINNNLMVTLFSMCLLSAYSEPANATSNATVNSAVYNQNTANNSQLNNADNNDYRTPEQVGDNQLYNNLTQQPNQQQPNQQQPNQQPIQPQPTQPQFNTNTNSPYPPNNYSNTTTNNHNVVQRKPVKNFHGYIGIQFNYSKLSLVDDDDNHYVSSNIWEETEEDSADMSFILGMEYKHALFSSNTDSNLKLMVATEIFLDSMDQTNKSPRIITNTTPAPWPIQQYSEREVLESKAMLGVRAKLGFQLFNRLTAYASAGYAGWNTNQYTEIEDYWGGHSYAGHTYKINESEKFRGTLVYGAGINFHCNDNIAINVNYQYAEIDEERNSYVDANGYFYKGDKPSLETTTVGISFYF